MHDALKIAARAVKRICRRKYIRNVNGSASARRALLCHLVYPFITRNRFHHIQYLEARMIAAELDKFGYSVDVIEHDYPKRMDYENYDVLIGMGLHVRKCFERRTSPTPRVILYSPGVHNHEQNIRTLRRIRDFHDRHGIWLLESGRFAGEDWTSLAILADGVIVLGDDAAATTYQARTDRPVYSLPGFFYQHHDARTIIQNRKIEEARCHYLWFGSHGLIHKGLDLAVEATLRIPGCHLHVCGPLQHEKEFVHYFRKKPEANERIHWHGFLSLGDRDLTQIFAQCAFVLNPSCSEGGSPAAWTAIGNGGLIPIATRQSAMEIDRVGITIDELTVESVEMAMRTAHALSENEIRVRALQSIEYAEMNHSPTSYANELSNALRDVLANSRTSP